MGMNWDCLRWLHWFWLSWEETYWCHDGTWYLPYGDLGWRESCWSYFQDYFWRMEYISPEKPQPWVEWRRFFLTYVLRKSEPPKSFSSLHEKLEYLIPLKTNSAQFRRDSNRIFTKIEGLIKNDMIKPLLQKFRISNNTASFRNGRACFLSLQDYYHGNQQKNVKLFTADNGLQKTHWTNIASFTAENYTMNLLNYLILLTNLGCRGTIMLKIANSINLAIGNLIPYLLSFGSKCSRLNYLKSLKHGPSNRPLKSLIILLTWISHQRNELRHPLVRTMPILDLTRNREVVRHVIERTVVITKLIPAVKEMGIPVRLCTINK